MSSMPFGRLQCFYFVSETKPWMNTPGALATMCPHNRWVYTVIAIFVFVGTGLGYAQTSSAQPTTPEWLGGVNELKLAVRHCTAFASVPGEDSCIVGTLDGQILVVSLPNGTIAPLASLGHAIQSVSVNGYTSNLAVVTYDKTSMIVSVVLVPLKGGRSQVVDRRMIPQCVSSKPHWSQEGRYLGVSFASLSKDSTDWVLIDIQNKAPVHVESDKELHMGAASWDLTEVRAFAFTKHDTFFAFVKLSDRRSSLGYFAVSDRDAESLDDGELPRCRRVDTVSLPGGAFSLGNSDDSSVAVLLRDFSRLRYSAAYCRFDRGHLQVSSGPMMPGNGFDRVPVTSDDTKKSLFTMTRILAPNIKQVSILEKVNLGVVSQESKSVLDATTRQVLRVSSARQAAVYFGQGQRQMFHFLDISDSQSRERAEPQTVNFEKQDYYSLAGDFCGQEEQYFVSVNILNEDPNHRNFIEVPTVLRVWEFSK